MLDEKEKVDFFIKKESAKLQTSKFIGIDTYYSVYTHPKSKNSYLYWGGRIVTPLVFQNIGHNNFRAGAALVVNNSDGGRTVYCLGKKNTGNGIVPTLMIYTGHLLSRYRERYNYPDSMHPNELICNFLNRNSELIPLDYAQFSEKEHPNGTALQGHDGIILGSELHFTEPYEFYVVRNNTFVPQSLLKGKQADALMTKKKMRDIIAENMREIVKTHPVLSQFVG